MEKEDIMKAVLGSMIAGSTLGERAKKKKKDEPEEKEGMLIIVGEEEEEPMSNSLSDRLKKKAKK